MRWPAQQAVLAWCLAVFLAATLAAVQAQQLAPQPAAAESAPPSAANLKTARTIFIEPMPENFHIYLTAKLSEEFSKKRLPYRISLDKDQADLWMTGTLTVSKYDPSGLERALGTAAKAMGRPILIDGTASVFIVPRGSQEVLWAGDAWRSAEPGAHGPLLAGVIVKKFRKDAQKALKQK